MAQIELRDVSVIYENAHEEVAALDGFSAVFGDGINVVIGSSGCGKTTLLTSVLGLTRYDGQILMNGKDLVDTAVEDRHFAYVAQNTGLFPQFTVFENIAFPLKMMGAGREEIIERVRKIAELTDLTPCLSRNIKHVSGGQQQKTAIARALVKRPSVCLLDEPFSQVDGIARVRLRQWMKELFSQFNCLAIHVTHDLPEALSLADHLYVMDEGKLAVCGRPQDVYMSGNEVMESLKVGGY